MTKEKFLEELNKMQQKDLDIYDKALNVIKAYPGAPFIANLLERELGLSFGRGQFVFEKLRISGFISEMMVTENELYVALMKFRKISQLPECCEPTLIKSIKDILDLGRVEYWR